MLYATGTGLFFAVGTVTSDPYRDQEDTGDWPWRINVKLDHWRDFVHEGEPAALYPLAADGSGVPAPYRI